MLEGQTIFVTGAGGALGKAVTGTLREDGATVVGLDHRASEDVIVCDLTDEAAVGRTMDRLVDAHGVPDGLVLLAGTYAARPLRDIDRVHLDGLLQTNLTSAVTVTAKLVPLMAEKGYGRVVAIGAYAIRKSSAGQAVYNASKAALVSFMETVAEEVKEKDVAVMTLLPTTLDTEANRRAMPSADPGRWVRLDRLTRVVAFLMSEAAGDLNGASIAVRGRL